MNIWILTIGSSDVQLKPKNNWKNLFGTGRNQLKPDRGFSPAKDPVYDRLRVPARVLGVIYSQSQAEQHFHDLVFPLIDNFLSKIQDKLISKIILILSDQSVFSLAERSPQHHVYWQDTCTLQPILEKYLKNELKDYSPNLHIQPLFLRPISSTKGLDDWDSVLKLVQHEFSQLKLPDDVTIYVSHQASTPAISSAVQFTSLAKFGERVKFLVSNERDAALTRFLPSSAYLRGIRQQEAKALLKSYDYSGMQKLISPYLDVEHKETQILLEAAIQWNYAKFEEFADKLQKSSDQKLVQEAKERSQHWWWTAYEAAWLGVVRLKQENTVEAMFHSFRALEGLAIRYALNKGLNRHGKKVFRYLKSQKQKQWKEHSFINKLVNLEEETDLSAEVDILGRRNTLFHQLSGFTKDNLFDAWNTNEEDWQEVVVECLNFISDQSFASLEDASLMAKVHQELKESIDQL